MIRAEGDLEGPVRLILGYLALHTSFPRLVALLDAGTESAELKHEMPSSLAARLQPARLLPCRRDTTRVLINVSRATRSRLLPHVLLTSRFNGSALSFGALSLFRAIFDRG